MTLRHLLVILCSVTVFLAFPGLASAEQKSAETHYRMGKALLKKGATQEAFAQFRQALKRDPRHVATLLELADLYSAQGSVFEAYSLLQQAAAQEPERARLYALFGRCYFHLRKFPEARQHFHRALELEPSLREPHFALAVIEADLGRLAEALEHIETFLSGATGSTRQQAYTTKARIALKMKDYDTALTAYRALLRDHPARVDIQQKIARILLAAKRYAEADKAYEALLKERPGNRDALQGWFEANYKRGAYQKAIEAMERLREQDRWSCGPLINLARTYRMLNQFAKARGYAERCLQIIPSHTMAHYTLGRILFRQGDLEGARSEFSQAVQSNSDHAEALYWLATTEIKLNQAEAALARLKKVVELDPDYAPAHYALALEYARRGLRQEADAQMQRFREIKDREKWKSRADEDKPAVMGGPGPGGPVNPDRLDEWTNFAKYLIQEDKPRDAVETLREAQTIAPNDPEILRLIAVAKTEMGKIDEALAAYAEAEEQSPGGLLFLGRGELYFQLQETQAALADLRRAAASDLPPDKKAKAYLLIASLLSKERKYQEAEAAVNRALDLDPQNEAARTLRLWMLVKSDKPEPVVTEAGPLLEEHPQNVSARLALVEALLQQGKVSAAGTELRRAAAMEGETPQILLERGKVAAAKGRETLAIDYLKRASEADPSQVEAFYLLGKILAREGQAQQAAQVFKKATIVDATHVPSWIALGRFYLAEEAFEKAIGCFQEAVAVEPANPEAHYQLAVAFKGATQLERALDEARQARSLGHPAAAKLLHSLRSRRP